MAVPSVEPLGREADGSAFFGASAAEAMRGALMRVLDSPDFVVPDRARRFLSYVVEEALCGRADRIKAFSIATHVLGRDSSFDGSTDPVVRIEAGRVRQALEHYYLTAGADDPIIITIPKGGYVPTFTRRQGSVEGAGGGAGLVAPRRSPYGWGRQLLGSAGAALLLALVAAIGLMAYVIFFRAAPPAEPGGAAALGVSRLMVSPFQPVSDTPETATLARGLTEEVVRQLSLFKEIDLIAGPRPVTGQSHPPAQYELQGSIRLEDRRFRLTARLVDNDDGSIIWAENYDGDRDVSQLLETQATIAGKVATAVAQPYGVIFHTDAAKLVRETPNDWEAYACTLAYYSYRADLNPRSHRSVERCLERTTNRFPSYGTAWALLSLTYLDEVRFRYAVDGRSEPPLELAFEAARRAVDLDPNNSRALQAYMTALFFQGDVPAALKIGERGLALNPNDTELQAEYGLRLALSGQWDRGRDLMLDVLDRNPGPLGYFESVVALCYYMIGDYKAAGAYIDKARLTANPIYHLIAAATYGQLGREDAAKAERAWFAASAPDFLTDLPKVIRMRSIGPDDQKHLLEGLAKAGIRTTAS